MTLPDAIRAEAELRVRAIHFPFVSDETWELWKEASYDEMEKMVLHFTEKLRLEAILRQIQ